MKFFKYQSVGNDFVLLDFYEKSPKIHKTALSKIAVKTCDRHFGIGADGLLILQKDRSGLPKMLIFNSDGSSAEMCVNGLRCLAFHLFSHHHFLSPFSIKIGERIARCEVKDSGALITTCLNNITYERAKTISLSKEKILGHIVSVGNPHFLIFQKRSLKWLEQYGKKIESHPAFPQKINVSLVWQEKPLRQRKRFSVLVYERGCGITLACGSSAAAITKTLYRMGRISLQEEIILSMPGGNLQCTIDPEGNVLIGALATLIYYGWLC